MGLASRCYVRPPRVGISQQSFREPRLQWWKRRIRSWRWFPRGRSSRRGPAAWIRRQSFRGFWRHESRRRDQRLFGPRPIELRRRLPWRRRWSPLNSGSALKEMTIDDMENELMHTRNTKMGTLRSTLHGMVPTAVFQLLVRGWRQAGFAQGSEPKTFSSPTEACQALNQAVKNEDEQGVDAILGTG